MHSIIKAEIEVNKFFESFNQKSLKVSYILSQLDFSGLVKEDSYSKFSLLSIIRLYIFRKIKGLHNYNRLTEYLINNGEESFQLGFYKNENNKLDLPLKRTYNYYLQTKISSEEKYQLDLLAEKLLSLATKNKIILDIEIVKKTIREKKKSHEREIKEAIKLIKKLIYPQIDLKIKQNGKFTTKDLLDVLVHVALTHDFTNNGSFTFKEINQDKPAPSGDLMMYHFSKFKSVIQLREMFEKILDVIFNFSKKNYHILQQRKLNIAYDIHNFCYYGKNADYICGDKNDRGTNSFFKFLTCSIVVAGRRFILDVVPVHPLLSIDKLIDRSLERVKNKVRIDKAFLDRGFDKPKIINVLKKHNVKFIMPKIRSPTVKSWFDKSAGSKSRIIKDFQIGKRENKALVNLILVDDKQGIKRAFICNFNIAPCLAYRFYELYGKRWGIETGYRNLDHDFKPRTTTNNYCIRLFYFLFSCCLYNLGILVNICVSLAVYGRIKDKPLITAKMFAVLLYKMQIEIT